MLVFHQSGFAQLSCNVAVLITGFSFCVMVTKGVMTEGQVPWLHVCKSDLFPISM